MTSTSVALTLQILDSRRQIGPNLLHAGAGAALELVWGEDRSAQPGASFELSAPGTTPADVDALLDRAVAAWRRHARALLDGLGWREQQPFARRFAGNNQSGGPLRGATLAVAAPLDGLWTATELCEAAVAMACADARGETPDVEAALAPLRSAYAKESRRRAGLRELAAEAARRGVACIADDRNTSLGLGAGARVWPTNALPAAADAFEAADWSQRRDVPVAFVTGTNGKTTTARLLHAIGLAAGRVAGVTTTDWIRVGAEIVERGDCAGPDGARRVLRDPRVELAVLETARGAILRRGLVLPRADAAIVTNVAEDHLGQWGVLDLAGMREAKLVLARLVAGGGRSGRAPLVLNADDPGLAAIGERHDGPVAWFSLQAASSVAARGLAQGSRAALLERGVLVLREGLARTELLPAADVPVALGGAARHNVANALAAALAAQALGLSLDDIRAGLRAFRPEAAENPGRGNRYELGGVTALADFAHNVHAMSAQVELLSALPAKRRLVILGQAGDRSDDAIRALVRTAWRCQPERVIVKEQQKDLRGRQPGEVPAVIEAELARLGAPAGVVSRAASELDAVREALAWARPGDVLALFLHSQREECLALLDELARGGWAPGEGLPASRADEWKNCT
jgi:UDP-N-acetylmuramyl tripeptide synthase